MREAFPPFQLHYAAKTEIVRQIAHAPGHDGNLRMRQSTKRRFMKMVEMGVRQQHQIDGWKMFDF